MQLNVLGKKYSVTNTVFKIICRTKTQEKIREIGNFLSIYVICISNV